MSPTVVLVGAPGAGKTSVGRALATELGVTFTDTDEVIESREGRPVGAIFIDDGEDYFRDRERDAVADVLATEEGVVSLGGGAVMDARSQQLISQCRVVWLRVAPDTAVNRVGLNGPRPMLLGAVRSQLIGLLRERSPIYQQLATLTYDTDSVEPDEAAKAIAARLAADTSEHPSNATSNSTEAN